MRVSLKNPTHAVTLHGPLLEGCS